MRRKWINPTGNLKRVMEVGFTVKGSPILFIPEDPEMLVKMRTYRYGMPIRIHGKKLNDRMMIVGNVTVDRYKSALLTRSRPDRGVITGSLVQST